MNKIPVLVSLMLAIFLCNLASKLTSKSGSEANTNSSSSSTSNSSTSGSKSSSEPTASTSSEKVERPNPTAAQTAALEGGQMVTWEQQGITWTLPKTWSKMSVSKEMFNWGVGGEFLIVNISALGDTFPMDTALQAAYDGAKTEYKNGKYEELRWLELDGLKGVQFREAMPEDQGSPRRLQWQAYRKYAGQVQLINLILSTTGGNFAKHQDEFYAILYSTKIVQ
jgi:hypothetical protein